MFTPQPQPAPCQPWRFYQPSPRFCEEPRHTEGVRRNDQRRDTMRRGLTKEKHRGATRTREKPLMEGISLRPLTLLASPTPSEEKRVNDGHEKEKENQDLIFFGKQERGPRHVPRGEPQSQEERRGEVQKTRDAPRNTKSAHPEKARLPLLWRRKHHPSQHLLVERATLSVLRSLLNGMSFVEQHRHVKTNSTNNATC
jgi:hypothetical protein